MKRFVSAILVLVTMLGLAACQTGKSTADSTKKASNTELVLWWWGEGDTPGSKAWLEETVASYKKVKPNISIKLVEQTSDQLYPAWESAIQAGKGADIQFLWTGVWALDSVWKDELADISTLIPEDERNHWTATEGVSYQGKTWLSPWYQISIVWMYNKELFKKAGLDPANPPKNWDELLAACEALKTANLIPLELGGMKDGWGAAWLYSVFGPASHDSFKDYIQAATVPGNFQKPEHTLWLERLNTLYSKKYVNSKTMSYDFFQGRESFLRGESAMGLATNGQAIQWIEQMGGEDKVGLMRIPVMGDGKLAGKLNNQSHSFAIPKFSEHQQEAADFLIYTHQKEQLKRWYELTKNIPSDDRFDPAWFKTDSERWIYDYLTKDSIPYAEIFIPAMVDSEGMYAATQMIFNGEDPKKAAALMEETADKWRSMDPDGLENFKKWAEDFKD